MLKSLSNKAQIYFRKSKNLVEVVKPALQSKANFTVDAVLNDFSKTLLHFLKISREM